MRITVIGCGNGAFATAADLSSRGHQITLYSDPSHEKTLRSIKGTKIIKARGTGLKGDISVYNVTCDEREAFADPELVIVTVPANSQEDVAHTIAPHVRDGMRILLSPGGTGGALVFYKILREESDADGLRIGEFHTLPYTARKSAPDTVDILLEIKFLMFAAMPASYNGEMFELVSSLYPAAVPAADVLETSLNNGNFTTHPAPVVLNAGKIEYYGRHSHYEEGMTPSVSNVVQIIDDERKKISRALGYEEIDIKDRLHRMGYCEEADTVYDSIRSSTDVFRSVSGPDSLDGRYLTEDTPCGLVAAANIARAAGVITPVMDAVIELAGALRNTDYRREGRTMDRMGIGNMRLEEIKEYVRRG